MRVLILGGHGMLGAATAAVARARGFKAGSRGRAQLDLVDTESIQRALDSAQPLFQAVINCAAFTAVDDCESKVEHAMEVNGHAVGRLARLCRHLGLPLVHVSSDYVFKGDGVSSDGSRRPYVEDDAVDPQSVYGQSKELGERLALAEDASVVRASWLFGPGGPNFVATMLRLASSGKPLRVVDDQVGCPTYTPDLAEVLLDMVEARVARAQDLPLDQRLFHFANPPAVSWFGFASEIFELFGQRVDLSACTTEEFLRPAPRPAYSVLATDRYQREFDRRPRSWRHGLEDYRAAMEEPSLSSDALASGIDQIDSEGGESSCTS